MSDETYLGDGLYCSFDGIQIKLRAPRDEGDHVVYLESDVFHALYTFAFRCGFRPLPQPDLTPDDKEPL